MMLKLSCIQIKIQYLIVGHIEMYILYTVYSGKNIIGLFHITWYQDSTLCVVWFYS